VRSGTRDLVQRHFGPDAVHRAYGELYSSAKRGG
jgi:hypothetical protein